jgi:outer membrane protein OmpA-like peptidoglycan-associated protein
MKNSILVFSVLFLLWSKMVGQIPTTIFFSYDSDKISEESKKTIAQIPKENLQKIILIGHCDSTGSYTYNYNLSMRRANGTKNELMNLGFSPSQWQIVGKSFSSPNSSSQKAKNRRVEIIPIYNDEKIHHLSLVQQTNEKTYIVSYQKAYFAKTGQLDSLPKLKLKRTYKVENLFFVPNKAIVLEESHPALMALFLTMQCNSTLKIKIEGHTNGVRSKKTPEWHSNTSAARAQTTKDYLVSLGISEKRISTVGFGHKHMLFPEGTTKEELKQNRRVEVKVIAL